MQENRKKGPTPKAAEKIFRGKTSKLKRLRVDSGMSQQELADKAGIKSRTVKTYEQMERNINHARLDSLVSICEALDCGLEDILEDEELIKKYERIK